VAKVRIAKVVAIKAGTTRATTRATTMATTRAIIKATTKVKANQIRKTTGKTKVKVKVRTASKKIDYLYLRSFKICKYNYISYCCTCCIK